MKDGPETTSDYIAFGAFFVLAVVFSPVLIPLYLIGRLVEKVYTWTS